jgi:homoserine O-acetyltransferase
MSEAQRHAIYADPNWADGLYRDDATPEQGLAAARMMAVCSYRSWASFERRFGRARRDGEEFEMQAYLRHQGCKINERFDANTYVRLTQAMNDYDLSRGRGEYPAALSCIRQPALVVSISSDILYPPQEQRVLADALPNARYEILDSPEGHDGFLIQSAELGDLIASFREGREARSLRAPARRARLSAVAE